MVDALRVVDAEAELPNEADSDREAVRDLDGVTVAVPDAVLVTDWLAVEVAV